MNRIFREDILPCLNFNNKKVSYLNLPKSGYLNPLS